MLLFNSAAIQTEYLLLVRDFLACAIVHLFECHIYSHVDVFRRLGLGLVQASVGSAKVTAFDLEICPSDLGQVSAQVKERVRFQEELVEDFIAVLLVLITASVDIIGTAYA